MPESQAQVRLAHAVAEGGARSAMPPKVAREIIEKMHGRKMGSLPEKAATRKRKRGLFGR
jgi:hypothetical protein